MVVIERKKERKTERNKRVPIVFQIQSPPLPWDTHDIRISIVFVCTRSRWMTEGKGMRIGKHAKTPKKTKKPWRVQEDVYFATLTSIRFVGTVYVDVGARVRACGRRQWVRKKKYLVSVA